MMTNSILKSDDLSRVKELLEKYKFNVKSYVAKQEKELYYLDEKHHRPRVIVSLTVQISHTGYVFFVYLSLQSPVLWN